MNGYQGQIRACDQQNQKFLANQQLFQIIQEDSRAEISYVKRLGISAKAGTKLRINNIQIEVGKTNIYEVDQVEITSIQFQEDTTNDVILDFIIQTGG